MVSACSIISGIQTQSHLIIILDDPSSFNNPGKYPVFLINGCDAGNIYSYDPARLQAISSLAEKFVLAKNGGAIAFIGNSHYGITNYLDAFNTGFYQSLQKQNYNDAVSVNIKAGAQYLLNQSYIDSATKYLEGRRNDHQWGSCYKNQ
jgi:hypothetical protein